MTSRHAGPPWWGRWRPSPVRLLQVGSLLVLLAVWEIVGRSVSPLVLSPFSKTLAAWFDLLTTGQLLAALATSAQALFLGFALALVLGVGGGLLLARLRPLETVADFYLTILLAAPMATIIPVVNVFLGFTVAARVAVVFLFAIVVIVVNTLAGVRAVDRRVLEMAQSFGATERQLWAKVLFPAALPAIMAGVRLGLARAVLGVLTAELVLSTTGMGNLVIFYQSRFQTDYLFALILTLVGLGVGLIAVVQVLERRLMRWRVAGIE